MEGAQETVASEACATECKGEMSPEVGTEASTFFIHEDGSVIIPDVYTLEWVRAFHCCLERITWCKGQYGLQQAVPPSAVISIILRAKELFSSESTVVEVTALLTLSICRVCFSVYRTAIRYVAVLSSRAGHLRLAGTAFRKVLTFTGRTASW
jgi:hypothetical protein